MKMCNGDHAAEQCFAASAVLVGVGGDDLLVGPPGDLDRDVLVGGEESGGIAVKGHVPERDGIYIGLTVVEMMMAREMRLSERVVRGGAPRSG